MGRSALGGFVEGLQGGMQFRQDARRNKRIDKALDYELSRIDRLQRGEDAAAVLESGDSAILHRTPEQLGLADPYDFSLRDWGSRILSGVKGAFTRNRPAAVDPTSLQAPEMRSVGGVPEYAIEADQFAYRDGGYVRRYADGGDVERRRAGRFVDPDTGVEFIDGVPQGRVPTSGGGVRAALGDVGRNTLPNTQRRMREWAPHGMAADRAVLDAENASQRGAAIRGNLTEGAVGMMNLGAGLYEDSGVDSLVRGVGGFLGFGDQGGQERSPEAAAVAASDVAAQPAETQGAADPTAAAPSRPGAGAGTGGGEAIPGVRSGAAQGQGQFDWANVRAMPEDVPTMSTRDWQEYRGEQVAALMAQGLSANEAHEQVTQIQQRGFLNHAQQAFQFMQMGDVRSASLALKAAYQYFPNGADVKFGLTQDAQGQPALVAMGTDEESGESRGQPMLINSERLAVMMENMTNPNAFRSWTKDWRTEDFERQIYEEYTKPIGQAGAQTSRMNAEANLLNAQSAASSGGRSGLRQSDYDRAFKAMDELLGEMGLMEEVAPEDLDYLRQIAGIAYEQDPGNYLNTVSTLARLYRQGGVEAVDAAIRGSE